MNNHYRASNATVVDGQELKPLPPGAGEITVPASPGGSDWSFNYKLLSSHLLAVGSIGSGKTNLLYHIVKSIVEKVRNQDIIIFFDSKGDFLKRFYRQGDYVVGNSKQYGGYPLAKWNLYKELAQTGALDREDTIREVATSLFQKKMDTAKDPTFASGARDIFAALIEAQFRNGEADLDNASLRRKIRGLDIAGIKSVVDRHADLRWINIYMHNESSATTQSFLSPLGGVINDVFSSHFAESGDFSIRRAISARGGRSVFLEYDIVNSNLLDTVYTVLLDLASKDALGNTDENRCVYFILDEFPLIPRLNYIDNLLNFGRTRGVRVVAGIQNINQVLNTYGESLGTSILSGFSTYAAFHLFDKESRQFISERHGANRKLVRLDYADATRNGEQIHELGKVIEDWDIVKLKQGQCILSLPDSAPYLFYPAKYPEHKERISIVSPAGPRIQIKGGSS